MTKKNMNNTAPDIGQYQAQLWKTAEALRGSIDAAEYKHVILPLIFLKYISDSFQELHQELESRGEDPEEPDCYTARNVFWVPREARWSTIQDQPDGAAIGQAMTAIEQENPALRGILPRDYGRNTLDQQPLGDVINLISTIKVGGADAQATDVLGRVYEYFLEQFAMAEGRKGGEFYTPRPVVQLLVKMTQPYQGRVYDPCCGSAGMFTQSVRFIEAHANGRGNRLSIYGQESNQTTWRLARINLAIRGIQGQIEHGDSLLNDRHPNLKADCILANPPFNMKEWHRDQLLDDQRWAYGLPPAGNANYAWVQHFLHHLAPRGAAGFVLANGSTSSNQTNEKEIRKNIIEAGLVDCITALPAQLFRSTQIPACLWFLRRGRQEREGETLFIDARRLGHMTDRTHRDLSEGDIDRIAGVYHAWRNQDEYADVPGFCKSAALEEIRIQDHALTPGRYVGAEPQADDGETFPEKMTRLTQEWWKEQEEAQRLDEEITRNLETMGFSKP